MFNDSALFGDDPPASTEPAAAAVDGIADWQIEQLRRALDTNGVTDMAARQQVIEQLAGRPVASLRQLKSPEARTLLEQLQARSASAAPRSQASTWDDRDQDTWIDKL